MTSARRQLIDANATPFYHVIVDIGVDIGDSHIFLCFSAPSTRL
ncbi:hypothetical protein [Shewanella xiamenensis]|nr:hypothetical protein [Shewanella xiamenensis]MDI5846067.1 hypothetical protein [Shewanella xiamenensis]MDI5846068.1 hypothetical protein [Shewanella xiamenensis]MDI5873831.1 hypothetical protein [Shewanella xiamenensis]